MLDYLKYKAQPPERAHRIQVRFAAVGPNKKEVINLGQTMVAGLESYRYINFFTTAKHTDDNKLWQSVLKGEAPPYSGFCLCTTELAGLVHILGAENPLFRYVERSVSRVVEPPRSLLELDE